MSDNTTTDRAQRQQAVDSGDATSAVDRLAPVNDGALTAGSSRSRQLDRQREVASEIEVDDRGVAVRDVPGGVDAFLRSSGVDQFGARLRSEFAGAADYVTERDVDPGINPQRISATPQIARDRRDDVAARAREQTASDTRFIEGDDLAVDVGARGVTGLEVAKNRRDDVAARARQGLAAEDPYADPEDFSAEVTATGIESAGLTDAGAERRASEQFAAETPLNSVTPDDVTPTDSGFTLDSAAQRRAAARQFESEIDLFGAGELDPSSDVRETSGGFGLAEAPARELAASQLSDQTGTTVSPSDVELTPTDSGFEAVFERGGR